MGICRLKYKIYQLTLMYGPYLDTVFVFFFKFDILKIAGNMNWIFYDKEFLLFTDEMM